MSRLLGVGDAFPGFSMHACVSTEPGAEFRIVDLDSLEGKWAVIFFWPLDFTFVCPTELVEFGRIVPQIQSLGARLLGVSGDSHYVHLAWRREDARVRDVAFPMLADYRKELAEGLGILHPAEGVPLRATYIVDPEGVIRWLSVHDLNVGRNTQEVLRVLEGLQTGELCPANWTPGQATLTRATEAEHAAQWDTAEYAALRRLALIQPVG